MRSITARTTSWRTDSCVFAIVSHTCTNLSEEAGEYGLVTHFGELEFLRKLDDAMVEHHRIEQLSGQSFYDILAGTVRFGVQVSNYCAGRQIDLGGFEGLGELCFCCL